MHRLIKRFFNWNGFASGEGGFIQAAMMAAPYVLQGLSALGGIFGNKRKYLDPRMLMEKYGPHAVGQLAQQYANQILNSAYGQQLMSSAATSGQEAQTALASRAAASGLDASSGGASGASDFAAATAPQIQGGLERGVKSDVWQSSLGLAQDQLNQARALEMSNNAEQNANNPWKAVGQAAAGAAAMFPGKAPGGPTNSTGLVDQWKRENPNWQDIAAPQRRAFQP